MREKRRRKVEACVCIALVSRYAKTAQTKVEVVVG